jgi:hypothetical protein
MNYQCLNPSCRKMFESQRKLNGHYGYYALCAEHSAKVQKDQYLKATHTVQTSSGIMEELPPQQNRGNSNQGSRHSTTTHDDAVVVRGLYSPSSLDESDESQVESPPQHKNNSQSNRCIVNMKSFASSSDPSIEDRHGDHMLDSDSSNNSNNAIPGNPNADEEDDDQSEQLAIESFFLLEDHPNNFEAVALDDLLSCSSSHSTTSSDILHDDEPVVVTNPAEEPEEAPQEFGYEMGSSFPSVHRTVPHLHDDVAMLELIEILDKAKAPRGVFDKVTKWIATTLAKGVDLSHPIPSRESFVKRLKKRFPAPKATMTTLQLETDSSQGRREERQTVNIYHWDFVSQLKDLLADHHLFGDLENLVVNSVDEFLPYPNNPNEPIDEVMTGRWYQRYVVQAQTDCKTQFIIPIIMAIDKTPIAGNGRYSLEPLMFTTALLKNPVRENPRAWRHLGLVPDFEEKSKARRASYTTAEASKGRAQRNYHGALAIVLESFIKAQEGAGIPHALKLGKMTKILSLQCPLAFVITDGLGADGIVGRMQSTLRTDGTGRRCRGCDCDCDQAHQADPYHQCNQLQQAEMERMYHRTQSSDKETVKKAKKDLYAISQHSVNNAFWPAVFLPSRRGGIYSSLPVDPMHAFEEGILTYVLHVFIGTLPVYLQAQVDELASQMFQQCPKQTERRNFPRTNFTKGITNLSFLAAHERVGLLLSLCLLATTEKGAMLLCSSGDWDYAEPRQGRQEDRRYIADFIEVLELLLCLHAYYKSGTFWSRNDNTGMEKKAQEAVAYTLAALQQVLPRNTGHGWAFQKMHDTAVHLMKDISEHGRSANFDTSGPERNHKTFAKDPARTSQKRGNSIFLDQSSSRINENQVFHNTRLAWGTITHARDELVHNDSRTGSSWKTRSAIFGTKLPLYHVRVGPSSSREHGDIEDVNAVMGQATWLGQGKSRPNIHPVLTQYLVAEFAGMYPWPTIDCYTEVIVGEQPFRAHPDYDGNGPWYDWVFTQWEVSTEVDVTAPPYAAGLVTSIRPDDCQEREEEWESDNGNDSQESKVKETPSHFYVPAKLLCFIRAPVIRAPVSLEEDSGDAVNMELVAIVHSCEDIPMQGQETHITRRWVPEYEEEPKGVFRPYLRVIPVTAISCGVLVVEPSPGIHELRPEHFPITEVKERRTVWANSFVQAAHESNVVVVAEERSSDEERSSVEEQSIKRQRRR